MENKYKNSQQQHQTSTVNNKYLDHVYCHSNNTNENIPYMRPTNNNLTHNNYNNTVTNTSCVVDDPENDFLALLKENKQLKAMLILHLDLIQEQSEQLVLKDKQLVSQAEKLDALQLGQHQLELQIKELQNKLQRQIKRPPSNSAELASLSPPPLAKIQCTNELGVQVHHQHHHQHQLAQHKHSNKTIIGECNGKLISKIILQRVRLPRNVPGESFSPNSSTNSESISEFDETGCNRDEEEDNEEEEEEDDNADADDNDADDNKDEDNDGEDDEDDGGDADVNQDANIEIDAEEEFDEEHEENIEETIEEALDDSQYTEVCEIDNSDFNLIEASIEEIPASNSKTQQINTKAPSDLILKPGNSVKTDTNTSLQKICVTPPTPSRGKQMPLMLWHAPNMHSDDSGSGESLTETEQPLSMAISPIPESGVSNSSKLNTQHLTSSSSSDLRTGQTHNIKSRRFTYISTAQLYSTREWESEEPASDCEMIKDEVKELKSDAPCLEIPKWIEHELLPLYSIEGTEDLSDDTFLKRHSKLEIDEKRRKKWDVQQIREQRRIEKLKRRHCKEEIQNTQEIQPPNSFYPRPDDVHIIYFVNNLPVQAFGEMIPKLNPTTFSLPWLNTTTVSSVDHQQQQHQQQEHQHQQQQQQEQQTQKDIVSSSYTFVKKRRRRQSSSTASIPTARQKNLAATKSTTQLIPSTIAIGNAQTDNSTTK